MPPLLKQKPSGFSARRSLQKALADLEIAIEALLRVLFSRGPASLAEERAVLASWKVRSLAVLFLVFAALTGILLAGALTFGPAAILASLPLSLPRTTALSRWIDLREVGQPYDPALADFLIDPKLLRCTKPEVDVASYNKQLVAARKAGSSKEKGATPQAGAAADGSGARASIGAGKTGEAGAVALEEDSGGGSSNREDGRQAAARSNASTSPFGAAASSGRCTFTDLRRGPLLSELRIHSMQPEDADLLTAISSGRRVREALSETVKEPRIAFLFLTPGSLPFAPLWERFFMVCPKSLTRGCFLFHL